MREVDEVSLLTVSLCRYQTKEEYKVATLSENTIKSYDTKMSLVDVRLSLLHVYVLHLPLPHLSHQIAAVV